MLMKHNLFTVPANDTKLWRYQDISRYIDLLLRKQLFFSRADNFEDPFEGRYPRQPKALEEEAALKRAVVSINSWHSNKDENYAMWKIYGKGTYGLAVQTSFERLKRSLEATDKEIVIAAVHYYDNDKDLHHASHELTPFLHKRSIYSYEKEVRCCYVIDGNNKNINWEEQDKYHGVFIDADLDALIERIYISPYSPEWIKNIVAGINEKFGIECQIVHSTVFDIDDY